MLERRHHPVAVGLGDATMEERHLLAELLRQVLLQQHPHLAELGEHQGVLAGVQQVFHQLVEAVQLPAAAGQAGPVAQRVRRVVADLLQPGERGQHQPAPPHALLLLGVLEQLVHHGLIQVGLLAGERRPGDLLHLVRQVGHQRAVRFGAAQQERRREAAQFLRRVGVALALDGGDEPLAELGGVAQEAGGDHLEDAPQLAEAVLHRGAGEGDLLPGGDGPHGLGGAGVRVLHGLRFVQHERAPLHLLEDGQVARGHLIGGDDQVVPGHQMGERLRIGAAAAMVHHDPHEWREAGCFGLPVAHHAERADHQVWAGQAGQVGQRGGRLAQTHVVGQAPTEAQAVEELQPPQAAPLVVAQFGGEPLRHVALGELGVRQAAEQLGRPAASLSRFDGGDGGCLAGGFQGTL